MPRSALNNPTDRILRLLGEIDHLQAAYDDLFERARDHNIPLDGLCDKPPMIEFRLELQRQGNDYLRVRPNIVRTRERMQNIRDRDRTRGFKMRRGMEVPMNTPTLDDVEQPLSADDIEMMLEQDRKREAREVIEQGKQAGNAGFKSADSYKPDVKNLFSKTKPEE